MIHYAKLRAFGRDVLQCAARANRVIAVIRVQDAPWRLGVDEGRPSASREPFREGA
jgi:hypothetical protein